MKKEGKRTQPNFFVNVSVDSKHSVNGPISKNLFQQSLVGVRVVLPKPECYLTHKQKKASYI